MYFRCSTEPVLQTERVSAPVFLDRVVPYPAYRDRGLYLRIKTLLRLEQYRLLLDEPEGFFGDMVEKTGTLWEYRQQIGSYDHGFASYAAYAIVMALKGLGTL